MAFTLFGIILNMVLGVAIPVGLLVFIKKKYGVSLKGFWIGAATMVLAALVLEQLVHALVLGSPAGAAIQGNLWLYALYGGLMAGLFEETGRLVSMRFLMKKGHGDWHNALMYGAGHGGIEVFVILFFGMLNNLIYTVVLMTGSAETLMAPLDASSQAILQQAFDALTTTPAWMFLMASVERLSAVTAQIALSVIVWTAASGKNIRVKFYLLAIFLHFVLDASAAVLSRIGCPILLLEVIIWAVAIAFVVIAKRVREATE